MKLMEHLLERTADKLDDIAEELGLSPEDLDEEELLQAISERLLKPEVVAAQLSTLTDRQIALFERACDGMFIPELDELDDSFSVIRTFCAFPYQDKDEEKDVTGFLRLLQELERNPEEDVGEKFAEEFLKMSKIYVSVPDEIVPLYREINTPKFQELRHITSWLTPCLEVCGRLYAVTPVPILEKVYARKEPVSGEKLREIFPLFSDSSGGWVYDRDRDRILRWGMDEQEIQSILDRQGDRGFYIPELAEIEALSQEDYPLTLPAYENLHKFLEDYCGKDLWEASEAVTEYWNLLSEGDGGMQDALQWLIERTEVGPKFMTLLVTFYQNCKLCTRCVSYRGYTWEEVGKPDEATEMMELEFDISPRAIPIGRNDLCPCGSGKKYKKCCGR